MVGKMSFRMTAPKLNFFFLSFQFSSYGFLHMDIVLQSLFRQNPPGSCKYQHNGSDRERLVIKNICLPFSLHFSSTRCIENATIVRTNASSIVICCSSI